jgi:16S rRNA (cytosine1402-N4)-methyltransferase
LRGEGRDDQAGTGHEPVLADQITAELITDLSGIYLDGTIGGGGHAEVMLKKLSKDARYIGLDRDKAAVERSRVRLEPFGSRVSVIHSDYRNFASVLHGLGVERVHGVLLDLGLSSIQLDDPSRGFAYRFDGPLDLRFDTSEGQSAAEWLNHASEQEIVTALLAFGEERHAKRIARRIVSARPAGIATTGDLVAIIRKVSGPRGLEFGRSAARVFQALRIVVNDELSAIPRAMNDAVDWLTEGGRLVVIAYHSLEDRLVKTFMREAARECSCPTAYPQCICGANPRGVLVHRRAFVPSDREIKSNPRAKSAKMRVFERRSRLGGRR